MRSSTELSRAVSGRCLGGVCAGLADRFGVDVVFVRIAFVLAALFTGGTAFLVYLALWWGLPDRETGDDIDRILAARVQRGELSGEEYRRIVADLGR